MEEEKVWIKCTDRYKITDYSTDPPTVKEGIERVSVFDKKRDIMLNKEFYENGKVKSFEEVDDDKLVEIEYDQTGKQISKRIMEFENPDKDYVNERETFDDGTVTEEKEEYSNDGKFMRKYFLENREVASYLEFDYDDEDQLQETRLYAAKELRGRWEHIYENGRETMTMEYNPNGNLIEISVLELKEDGKSTSTTRLDGARRMLSRIEEDRDEEDKVLEQRIYDENDQLKEQNIFGPNNEFGDRLQFIEREYVRGKLCKESITKYEY